MTAELINVVDAEIVEARDPRLVDAELRDAARTVDSAWSNIERLVAEAQVGEIHAELGFTSWTAYLADVVSQELPNISRQVDQRRRVIELLSDAGMSQRAIAQAVGVNQATVSRDQGVIADQVMHDASPAAPAATRPDDTLTDEEADQLAEELIAAEPKPVTGLDGKTYPATPAAPREPRRKPIGDAFGTATFELKRSAERVVRLAQDDRFAKNKDQISGANLSDLVRVRDAINGVIQQIEG